MKSTEQAKAKAKSLKHFFSGHGIEVTHGLALEAVARLEGHKSWGAFLAHQGEQALWYRPKQEVQSWPVFVLALKPQDDDDLDEHWHVLPEGATLDNRWNSRYRGLEDDDAVLANHLLDNAGHQVVVHAVQARIPDVSKYGLPWYAQEESATRDMPQELKFAAVCEEDGGVSTNFEDTGDDSAETLWLEVRVHPELAKKLRDALKAPVKTAYVIRYKDGAYNQGSGFPCRKFEATQYATREEAQEKASELTDVAGIEEVPATAPVDKPTESTEPKSEEADRSEKAYLAVFAKVFKGKKLPEVGLFMDALQADVSKNFATASAVNAQAWIRKKMSPSLELRAKFERYTVTQLYGHLRQEAKEEYARLMLGN